MNQELWQQAAAFHGHICPGLAIGFRAAMAARDELGLNSAQDEEIVCIAENKACSIDAIQTVLGCTIGKGNLVLQITGKQVFNFYCRDNDKKLRLYFKLPQGNLSREEYIQQILEAPLADVFTISQPHYGIPQRARIFTTIICDNCGEGAAEHLIRLKNGKKLCLECFEK